MTGGKNKKTRKVRQTALVYCEGAHDLAFIRHVVNTYAQAGKTNVRIRTKQGKGGSPDSLIVEAVNVLGSFDRRLAKMDRDRSADEIRKAEKLSTKHDIVIVWSKPCIEALLLSILDGKDYSGYKSKTCKRLFESNGILANKRTDSRAYEKLFPLSVLEKARTASSELDQLINFIEG